MTSTTKLLLGAALGAATLALTAANASAAIACAGHVCWHTTERLTYPAESRIVVHEDNWRWRHGERYSWREHEGHGYWRGSRWTEF